MLAIRVFSDWFLEQPLPYKAALALPALVALLQVARDSF